MMIKFWSLSSWLLIACSLTLASGVNAKNIASQFNSWQINASSAKAAVQSKKSTGAKAMLATYSTDISQLRTVLLTEEGNGVISVPLPSGQLADFNLVPSSIMAAELAQSYPEIKTFAGAEVDNPNNKGRFDITPNGFHGMFYYDGELVFVEPKTSLVSIPTTEGKQSKQSALKREFTQTANYQSYLGKPTQLAKSEKFQFHQPKVISGNSSLLVPSHDKAVQARQLAAGKSAASQSAIKTYRLAISAAAEYTQFNGGTVNSALAEIVTLVNRLNEVYQRDLAIRLELVANNNLLVFTDSASDPFTNTSDDGAINTQVIDNIIGSSSYDIGHVVGTGGGGLAILGAVCNSQYKGDGVTGSQAPVNDAFYIDYVAHEIGHQFGANHTFNGTAQACVGNRVVEAAYEVGSGSTIMSYAGICGSQNLQNHSDAFFHTKSIDEINAYISNGVGNSCGTVTGAINNTAIVEAGNDGTIPAQTPFMLIGSATDVDSTNLTFSWQQFDLGAETASKAEQIDDGSRPLFRAWPPVSSSERILPKLDSILSNTTPIGEVLPSTNRELNFRLLVRDGEGGVSFDSRKITVVDTGEAFAVTSPILNDTWTSNNHNVSWQVAQTNISPINCASVDILLSTDSGNNFTKTLANNVANNGNNDVSLAAYCGNDINTTMARIKVVCSDNIFFAINNGNFSIAKNAAATDISITGQQTLSINQGESLTLSNDLFTYSCDTPTSLTIEDGNNYVVSGSTITPENNFSGTLSVGIIAHKGGVSSEVFIATITVVDNVEPEPEPEPEPPIPPKKSSGSTFWLLFAFLALVLRSETVTNY